MQVHIIGGWSEGPKHQKQIKNELKKAGHEITRYLREAEIIITHSAGCYFIPYDHKHKLTVVIGPPYWPGAPILWRTFQHVVLQAPQQIRKWGLWYWIRHRLWNIFYAFTSPFRTIKIWRSLKSALLEPKNQNNVLIIRNDSDVFCSPNVRDFSRKHKNIKFAQLPGLHDDFWTNPKPYIDLVLKEL